MALEAALVEMVQVETWWWQHRWRRGGAGEGSGDVDTVINHVVIT